MPLCLRRKPRASELGGESAVWASPACPLPFLLPRSPASARSTGPQRVPTLLRCPSAQRCGRDEQKPPASLCSCPHPSPACPPQPRERQSEGSGQGMDTWVRLHLLPTVVWWEIKSPPAHLPPPSDLEQGGAAGGVGGSGVRLGVLWVSEWGGGLQICVCVLFWGGFWWSRGVKRAVS